MFPAVITPFGHALIQHPLVMHVLLMAGLTSRGLACGIGVTRLLGTGLLGTMLATFVHVLWVVLADHGNLYAAAACRPLKMR